MEGMERVVPQPVSSPDAMRARLLAQKDCMARAFEEAKREAAESSAPEPMLKDVWFGPGGNPDNEHSLAAFFSDWYDERLRSGSVPAAGGDTASLWEEFKEYARARQVPAAPSSSETAH